MQGAGICPSVLQAEHSTHPSSQVTQSGSALLSQIDRLYRNQGPAGSGGHTQLPRPGRGFVRFA